ncbi:helix-turn-helix domain-containing protein [Massilia dura]|uniref:Helix-turn-helix domain-containing protein n=1 Tax=Pseudoduganella dura TaxID=321982 RepID=A0A6I3XQU1_9BURK|nr:AraC family transcriptional regulator ligand-binding domain-containing protein [Pseudoduganella dura]MUI16181.1 helix-turn-helix domain-containing protein [Pseudoduganella dura]GGY19212.1 AraC family transcriptional regulator [Pseudoduganella dura]
MIAWRGAAEPSIPACQQPALVLAFARSRDADEGALLRGTGIEALAEPGALVAPAQYLDLLANALRALDSPDTSFMLGQQLLPGHDGAPSNALVQAPTLREALALLCRWHTRLTPLLRPRFETWDGTAALYWVDSHGAPALRSALVEMHMTAVVALCRWLGGERLPWRFCFNRTAPRHVEQHHVHLSSALRFDCQFDAMLIGAEWLDRPWPRGSALAAALALRAAEGEPARPAGLLAALYDYLLERVRMAPVLERTAGDFGVSPATFKRQLARHGTHFQAELDQVRTHVALWMFHAQGADNEAVARYLGFHDAANFRRSFKRWTGLTPLLLKAGLAG